MEQLAPTDAQEQLASRLTAEQAQKDAERVDAWVGKREVESSQESVSSMMDYLDQRPTQETATPAPTGLEHVVSANTEAEYTPESQMDKDLAYLTEEFGKVESMPDVMAALDLLSDYCDKYALDRSVEKQLRAQLMQDRPNPVAPVAVEGVSAEVPAEVTVDAPVPVVEPSIESAEPQATVESVAEVPAEPEKKNSIDTDVSHFKVQYDDPETKAVVNGTMVGINRLNGKYVIKLDDGRSLELMTEDFVTMAEEDPSVVSQEAPEAVPQDATAEAGTTEAPVQAEGQPEAAVAQPEAVTDEPEKAKASATVLAIKGLYNKAKENWDQIPAAKNRFLLVTGALAVTAVGMYVAFKTGDNSVLATTGLEPAAEVPVAESVPVLLSPDAAAPDVAASALNAQQQAIVEAAQTSEFPWNAMAEVLGRDVASSELLEAVDRASSAGVNIVEHGARNSTNWWIEVNGTANTQRVIETLAPYIK